MLIITLNEYTTIPLEQVVLKFGQPKSLGPADPHFRTQTFYYRYLINGVEVSFEFSDESKNLVSIVANTFP